MEQNNFSYAAKRKVIGIGTPISKSNISLMSMIMILGIMIVSLMTVSVDAVVWGTRYTYDSLSDNVVNASLWTNTSSYVTESSGYIQAQITSPGIKVGYVYSNNMPNYNLINNITFAAYLYINGNYDPYTPYISLSVFGTIIKTTTGSINDLSNYTLIKNNIGTQFTVYDDGVYLMNITPINNIIQIYTYTEVQGAGNTVTSRLYPINYSYTNDTMGITLNTPINYFNHYNTVPPTNITFNISTTSTVNNLKNITLFVNSVKISSESITGSSNITTFYQNFSTGTYYWNVLVCDDSNNCKYSNTQYFYEGGIEEIGFNYTSSVYETDSNTFNATVIYNTIIYPDAYAYLVYNSVAYPATKTYAGANTIFSSTIDAPTSIGLRLFYFNIFFEPANPLNFYSTTVNNQTISAINLTNCNSGTGTIFLNMNYYNELLGNSINQSVSGASWNYWLGSGSVTKGYYFSTPLLNTTHSFCFTPVNRSIFYTNVNYQYGVTGTYPFRTYDTTLNTPTYLTLQNSTPLNVSLYSIAATDSTPIIIQVSDSTSASIIQGATVTVTKDINGVPTQVFNGITDGAGTVSIWLNTVTTYTITVSKTGCGSVTKSVIPVGSYNAQLNCAGNMTKYVSSIDGVSYRRMPADGLTSYSGTITYEYNVVSVINPIFSAKFELVDDSKNVVASNTTLVSSGYSYCTNSSCTLSIVYTTACGDNIKGRYYVNLGNTTNYTYILLEADALWRFICINTTNSQQSFTKSVNYFNDFFFQWSAGGQAGTTCRIYNNQTSCNAVSYCKWLNYTGYTQAIEICTLKDDYNKADFNRVIIIFFGMVVMLFIIAKSTGYEMTNPGSFVMFMTGAIIIMSFAGMFRFTGATLWPFFDQWIYACICLAISVGYNISIVRRYSA